ncbi:MAG: M23 family metallopeptidase [Dehalococcoidia bacterium]|nr:M23 family metallopeptidase [Dehalococcoidia bacterium]
MARPGGPGRSIIQLGRSRRSGGLSRAGWIAIAAGIFVLSLLVRTCVSGGDGQEASGAPPQVASPTPSLTATPVHFDAVLQQLTGFIFPIRGACIPDADSVMPNAPRTYRNGVHEGVDFYDELSCATVTRGTNVMATRDGLVTRADRDYRPLTRAEAANADSLPETLDRFRGRQVWIDHGADGSGRRIVTRYAHLDSIEPGTVVGQRVRAGQVIAHVGNSGTPESLDQPNAELHLHFELRIGEGFLSQGDAPDVVRRAYARLFA